MSLTTDLKMAYHMGYDDALAKRKPDASKVHVFGRGTCHDTEVDKNRFVCSGCGCSSYIATVHMEFDEAGNKTDEWMDLNIPFFCPNCGAKVVDPTTNDADAEVAE